MGKEKDSATEFVVCLNNQDYPASLERNKIYRAIPDELAMADGDLQPSMKAEKIICIRLLTLSQLKYRRWQKNPY